MSPTAKTRLFSAVGIVVLICAGLLSRKTSVIPACVGDALWAAVVYCCWRIVLAKFSPGLSAAAALVTSFAVEFSQLLTPPWLVRVRSTLIGHLLLGQGFLWSDLAAYTVGVAVMLLISLLFRRLSKKR